MEQEEKLEVIRHSIIPVIGWKPERLQSELMALSLIDLKNLAREIRECTPIEEISLIEAAIDDFNDQSP